MMSVKARATASKNAKKLEGRCAELEQQAAANDRLRDEYLRQCKKANVHSTLF